MNAVAFDLYKLVAITADDLPVDKMAFLVQRLVRLRNDILVFLIRHEIVDLVRNGFCFGIVFSIWSLNESVFVDSRICT